MGVATYTFALRGDGRDNNDDMGIALADNATAYRYACTVARELMRCRETQTRYWRIRVYRDGEGPVFDVLFATVDPTLDHLRRELRTLVESVSRKTGALKDVLYACEVSLRESRSLLAQSRGKPYLIAEDGEFTIRNFAPTRGRLKNR